MQRRAVEEQNSRFPETLWIVRHGQSSGNVARDLAESQGSDVIDVGGRDTDIPLSKLGQRQAGALGTWFAALPKRDRPTRALVSPYVRARETAEIVLGRLGGDDVVIPCAVDERLREREFGIIDRLTHRGIVERFPDQAEAYARIGKFYYRPPGGESWCDVILRLRSVLEVLAKDYVGERVLIVAHEVVVYCFRYLIEGLNEQQILTINRTAAVSNCALTSYIYEPAQDRLRLQAFNFEAPLTEAGEKITKESDVPVAPK